MLAAVIKRMEQEQFSRTTVYRIETKDDAPKLKRFTDFKF